MTKYVLSNIVLIGLVISFLQISRAQWTVDCQGDATSRQGDLAYTDTTGTYASAYTSSDPVCAFQFRNGQSLFSEIINWLDGSCGVITSIQDTYVAYYVMVVFEDGSGEVQKQYNVSCEYYLDDATVTNQITVEFLSTTHIVVPTAISSLNADITLSVKVGNTNVEVTNVYVGQPIRLEALLNVRKGYFQAIRVTQCTAYESPSKLLSRTITTTSGCGDGFRLSTTEGFSGVGGLSYEADTPTFSAFKFVSYDLVIFVCTINFCINASDPVCTADHCQPGARRRRELDSSMEMNITAAVGVSSTVDPRTSNNIKVTDAPTSKCDVTDPSIIVLLALAILLALLNLFFLIYVCVKLTRRRRKKHIYMKKKKQAQRKFEANASSQSLFKCSVYGSSASSFVSV